MSGRTGWAIVLALPLAGCGDDGGGGPRSAGPGKQDSSSAAPGGAGAGGAAGAGGGPTGTGGGSAILDATADGADLSPSDRCAAVADWDPAWVAQEEKLLSLVNQERAGSRRCDAPEGGSPGAPLAVNVALRCSARLHAMDMAVRGFFDTTNPDGEPLVDRIQSAGYPGTLFGESIAIGQTPDALAAEPSVCANVMDARFSEVGIGYYAEEGGQPHWTLDFGG